MQKSKTKDPLDSFRDACRKHNLRVTPQRIAVYNELVKSKEHPSAEAMFQSIKKVFPNVSFDTINRTLLTFARIGLIDVAERQGGPRRFDPNPGKHHHLHCIKCGKIIDFYDERYDKLKVPKEIESRFKVLSKRVVLNILCEKCGKKK
jgi:Fur family peroxide stress response transcriptional regulator